MQRVLGKQENAESRESPTNSNKKREILQGNW